MSRVNQHFLFTLSAVVSIVALLGFGSVVSTAAESDNHGNSPQTTETPMVTGLSCAFPGSSLQFSLYSISSSVEEIQKDTRGIPNHQKNSHHQQNNDGYVRLIGFDEGTNINGDYHPEQGYIFSSDVNGSTALYHLPNLSSDNNTTSSSSPRLLFEEGASYNDHARWHPNGKQVAFVSTMQPGSYNNIAWTAVYLANLEGQVTQRVTPAGEPYGDFSPAWSPDGKWLAVARGSGYGDSNTWPWGRELNLTIINMETFQNYNLCVGGWPTWVSNDTIVFHRDSGSQLDEQWNIHWLNFSYSAEGGTVTVLGTGLLVEGALTPYALTTSESSFSSPTSVPIAFAFLDGQGLRQIGLTLWGDSSWKRIQVTIPNSETAHWNPTLRWKKRQVEKKKEDADDDGNSEIEVLFHMQRCNTTTANIRRIRSGAPSVVQDFAFVNGDFPSLSPDGRYIVQSSYIFTEMSRMKSDGSERKTIYNATSNWMTSWVKGNRVATTWGPGFAPANDSSVQVMTINSDGSDMKIITNSTNQNQGYPCYSPDGTKIVFRTNWNGESDPSGGPGPYHLVIIDEDGSNRRNLTIPSPPSNSTINMAGKHVFRIGDQHPHWGANDTIVFASDRGHPGRLAIWTIKSDGTDLEEVFDHGAQNVHPSMTPDGKHIVFASTIAGASAEPASWPFANTPSAELFAMTIEGQALERITHDMSENANVWIGSATLPKQLSKTAGTPTKCRYGDSIVPRPLITRQLGEKFLSDGTLPESLGAGVVAAGGSGTQKTKGLVGRPFPHGGMEEKMLRLLHLEDQIETNGPRCPFKRNA